MSERLEHNRIFTETLELLISYYFFLRVSKRLIADDPGGLDGYEQSLTVHLLHNDIVLRLCKLDDKRKDTWNYQQVLKIIPSGHFDPATLKELKSKIDEYVKSIDSIRSEQRHGFIAHLPKRKTGKISEYDFKKSIGLAVAISDLFLGERNQFLLSWTNPPIDLRKELGV